MSLLAKVKAAVALAMAASIAILYSMFRIEKAEKEKAKSDLEKASEANKETNRSVKAKEDLINVKDKVRTSSVSDIDDGLLKYDRSKNR